MGLLLVGCMYVINDSTIEVYSYSVYSFFWEITRFCFPVACHLRKIGGASGRDISTVTFAKSSLCRVYL